jgi:hypothetical protein
VIQLVEGWQFSWAVKGRLRRGVELIIEKIQLLDIRRTGRTWARETEESPLLTCVKRKRLLETLRAVEDLMFAAVICEVCRSAIALCLLVVPSAMYKWSINPFTSPYPVYSHAPKSRQYLFMYICMWASLAPEPLQEVVLILNSRVYLFQVSAQLILKLPFTWAK